MAQTAVYTGIAPAIAGQVMTANDSHFSPISYQADTALVVGRFVFLKTADVKKVVQAGTGALAGIVVRNQVYAHAGFNASNTVPAGQPVTPMLKGNVAVVNETDTTVAVGMDVYASQTDGHAIFATTAPESGATATPWKVVKVYDSGAKGEIVLISTYTK